MNVTKCFGKRLQEIRISRNLTPQQLAELVDLDIMSISLIESGLQYPKPDSLTKLANVLNVKVKEFYDFEENSKKDLTGILHSIIDKSSIKDLEFYHKMILTHLEYKNKNKTKLGKKVIKK